MTEDTAIFDPSVIGQAHPAWEWVSGSLYSCVKCKFVLTGRSPYDIPMHCPVCRLIEAAP